MNRRQKRKVAVAVSVCLAAAAISGSAGCGREEKEHQIVSEKKVMGRYLEEDIVMPEDCMQITSMGILEDGSIRIIYYSSNGVKLSTLKKETWTEPKNLNEVAGIEENRQYGGVAAIGKDGEMFISSLDFIDAENYKYYYHYISPDGKVRDIDLTEYTEGIIFEVEFTEKGTLLIGTEDGIKEIDLSDLSLVHTYEKGKMSTSFDAIGNRLIVLAGEELRYYDIETGKPAEEEEVLTAAIKENPENVQQMGVGQQSIMFLPGDEKDSLFYITHDGIFRYALGGSLVEQIADGKLNSIGSPDSNFTAAGKDKEGSFYIAALDESGSQAQGKMYRYRYSKDTPAVPDTELTVYSLTESNYLRQAAAAFQKKYPDIYLNIETGMTGEDAVTETDALKALNTEIMAGKGPDVLLMDGIVSDTYIEKGMLMDLSGIIKEAGLLENIEEPFKEENGAIYRMPAKFAIPYIQGRADYVESVESLETLADVIQLHSEEYTKDILPLPAAYSQPGLISSLAAVNMTAWVNEDRTMNQEAVTKFLAETGRIYNSSKAAGEELLECYGITAEQLDEYNNPAQYQNSAIYSQFGTGGLSLLGGANLLGTGGIYTPSDLNAIVSVERENPEITGKLWKGQSGECFIPREIMGISAKATEKEAAEQFITYLFSAEGQKVGMSGGLPVRKDVFEGLSYWMGNAQAGEETSVVSSYNNSTGEEIVLHITQTDENRIRKIQELGKSLKNPVRENGIIFRAVLEAGVSYLNEEVTLEEAVKKAADQVNLYLAE